MKPSPPEVRGAKNERRPHLCPPLNGSCHIGQPMSTGHYRLADGSLVRVDIELGAWVGRLYAADMKVKDRVRGTNAEIRAWLNAVAAFRAF